MTQFSEGPTPLPLIRKGGGGCSNYDRSFLLFKLSQKLQMFFKFYQVLVINKKSKSYDYVYLCLEASQNWLFHTKELVSLQQNSKLFPLQKYDVLLIFLFFCSVSHSGVGHNVSPMGYPPPSHKN